MDWLTAATTAADSSLLPIVLIYAFLILVNVTWVFWVFRKIRKPPKAVPPPNILDPPFDADGNFIFNEKKRASKDDISEPAEFGNEAEDEDDDEPWDTGSKINTEGAENLVLVHAQQWLSPSAAANLVVQRIFMGITLPEGKPSVFQEMIKTLESKGARAVTLAIAHANLSAELFHLGLAKPALEEISIALKTFEDGCAQADISVGEAAAGCIEDLHAAGYAAARDALRTRATLRRMRHPIALNDLLGVLIGSRDAARVNLAVPHAQKLFVEAAEAVKAKDFEGAILPLQRAYEALDDALAKTELLWPIAAACYDLALAKLIAGGQVISGISHMAEARRLERAGDVPEPQWRGIIEAAANAIVR